MVLYDMFRAEFGQIETRAAMAEYLTTALINLIDKVEQVTKDGACGVAQQG